MTTWDAALKELANEFSLKEEEVFIQGLRAFVREQIRLLDAERRARCMKFGVSSLEEMDELIKAGKVSEEEILEDFQQVDYLTAKIERLEKLLESLG